MLRAEQLFNTRPQEPKTEESILQAEKNKQKRSDKENCGKWTVCGQGWGNYMHCRSAWAGQAQHYARSRKIGKDHCMWKLKAIRKLRKRTREAHSLGQKHHRNCMMKLELRCQSDLQSLSWKTWTIKKAQLINIWKIMNIAKQKRKFNRKTICEKGATTCIVCRLSSTYTSKLSWC